MYCSLSGPSPTGSTAAHPGGLPCPNENLGPHPLAAYQVHQDKEIWPKMKEHSKTSERELRDVDIANLYDGEFKALVIEMLTEVIELG